MQQTQSYSISILKTVAMLVLIFLIQTVAGLAVEMLPTSRTIKIIIAILVQVGSYLLAIYLFYWRSSNRLDIAKVKGVSRWYFLLLALGLALFANITLLPLVQQLPQSPELAETMEALVEIPVIALLLIVLIGPFFEEIIFRNIILKGLKNRYNTAVAMIISSLLFGIFHLNFQQFVTATLLGFVCGAIYLFTKSVRYTIIFHMLYNFFVLFISGLFSQFDLIGKIAPPFGALVLVVVPITLLGIRRDVKRQRKAADETIVYE